MTVDLSGIEKQLAGFRREHHVTYKQLEAKGLSHLTVRKIFSGGEYKVSSLFRLMDSLGLCLSVNGKAMADMEALGTYLENFRLHFGYTRKELAEHCKLSVKAAYDLERGPDFHRSTLVAYTNGIGAYYGLIPRNNRNDGNGEE